LNRISLEIKLLFQYNICITNHNIMLWYYDLHIIIIPAFFLECHVIYWQANFHATVSLLAVKPLLRRGVHCYPLTLQLPRRVSLAIPNIWCEHDSTPCNHITSTRFFSIAEFSPLSPLFFFTALSRTRTHTHTHIYTLSAAGPCGLRDAGRSAAAAAAALVSCECAVYRNERLFTVIRQPGWKYIFMFAVGIYIGYYYCMLLYYYCLQGASNVRPTDRLGSVCVSRA